MAMRLMSGLQARVIQVLKDFLPAELLLIDAEESDSITMAEILAANYHEWDRQSIHEFPAVSIRAETSTLVGDEIKPDGFGRDVTANHRLVIMFHERAETDTRDMERRLERYAAGALRVLCIMKEALQTTADPTRFVEQVEWAEPIQYTPAEDQEDGAIVRTASLTIDIRRRELRG